MITKKKFNDYREVQMSGVTNMMMVTTVMSLSGLEKDECFDIMKNYVKYEEEFGKYEGV